MGIVWVQDLNKHQGLRCDGINTFKRLGCLVRVDHGQHPGLPNQLNSVVDNRLLTLVAKRHTFLCFIIASEYNTSGYDVP